MELVNKEFKKVINMLDYTNNMHGSCRKSITLSPQACKKLQKVSMRFNVSQSMIIDELIKRVL